MKLVKTRPRPSEAGPCSRSTGVLIGGDRVEQRHTGGGHVTARQGPERCDFQPRDAGDCHPHPPEARKRQEGSPADD